MTFKKKDSPHFFCKSCNYTLSPFCSNSRKPNGEYEDLCTTCRSTIFYSIRDLEVSHTFDHETDFIKKLNTKTKDK